ncbi:UDP-N-acetylenolpyruvoylglucosamine reductase [Paraglaciecola hydrolytica]|uniref:UDP-N-acetylenolpyruvoylglucosamine reductase n=1 Tax=Paraglaciecola hydrolytica TaxID=1799789 RepID=A0A148KMP4_9ALTE|nr:UDP-N-acetylenolpyruvoylglucosamine reductase [Paraglaciecola hydrolytica]
MHTFGFPAFAQQLEYIHTLAEAKQLLTNLGERAHYILGEGSNTVFLEDFAGSVFKIAIKGISLHEHPDYYELHVGAGENWHALIEWCLARNIRGFENLALIPGTVGAAPIQNIGAYGVEIEQFIHRVEYLCLSTDELKSLSREECQFAYRDSIFKHQLAGKFVIGMVTFRLTKSWQANARYAELKELSNPSAQDIFAKVVQVRQAKLPDPKKIGNAGSFFKNPIIPLALYQQLQQRFAELPSYPVNEQQVKVPAAWLIDRLGFKGKQLNGIHCHVTQPLVLTNDGSGTGEALLTLARQIKQAVKQDFAIELENEVQLVNNQGLVHV